MKKILIYAGPVLVLLGFLLSGIMRDRETGRAPGKRKPFPRERFSEKSTGKVPGEMVPVFNEFAGSLSGFLSRINADIEPIQPGTAAYRARTRRVAAFLKNHPAALEEAGEIILSEEEHVYTKWMLLGAIGLQSPATEAHALLRRLAADPSLGENVLVTLLGVFALAGEIPADSVDFMIERSETSDRLGGIAQATLGRIAGKIRSSDPGTASRIVSILSERLHDKVYSGRSRDAASTLESLAYTGERRVVSQVWPLTNHSCPEIRGAALVTLGALDPGASEARLRLALRQDPDPAVRIRAIEALMPVPHGVAEEQLANSNRMSEGTVSDFLAVVRGDENEQVRLEVMRAFHEMYETPPAPVVETLRHLAETDGSEEVREAAGWYLGYGYLSIN